MAESQPGAERSKGLPTTLEITSTRTWKSAGQSLCVLPARHVEESPGSKGQGAR